MRSLTRFALTAAAMALTTGTMIVATPAIAQKQKAPKVDLSKEFQAVAKPAQEAMTKAQTLGEEAKKLKAAGDTAGATAKEAEAKAAYQAARAPVAAMAPVAKTPDEINFSGEYELLVAANLNDEKGQAVALDRILTSGKADPSKIGAYNFFSGLFAYNAKDYTKAVTRMEASKQAGYTNPSIDTVIMDSYLSGGQPDKGIEMARAAIKARQASGQPMSEELFTRPAVALQKANRKPEMMEFVLGRVQYFPTKEYWNNAIDMVHQQAPTMDNKLDLMRLKSTAGIMADSYDYVSYSYYAAEEGLPSESLAAINAGKAKVQFTGSAASEISQREALQKTRLATDSKASLSGSDARAQAAANGKIAKANGDAWLSFDEYDKAAAMYELALTKGGVDADLVNTRLGIALAKKGDKAGAKAAFAKVGGARTTTAKLWSIYLDSGVKG